MGSTSMAKSTRVWPQLLERVTITSGAGSRCPFTFSGTCGGALSRCLFFQRFLLPRTKSAVKASCALEFSSLLYSNPDLSCPLLRCLCLLLASTPPLGNFPLLGSLGNFPPYTYHDLSDPLLRCLRLLLASTPPLGNFPPLASWPLRLLLATSRTALHLRKIDYLQRQ